MCCSNLYDKRVDNFQFQIYTYKHIKSIYHKYIHMYGSILILTYTSRLEKNEKSYTWQQSIVIRYTNTHTSQLYKRN